MAKKPAAEEAPKPKKKAAKTAEPILVVNDGEKRSYAELMKLPKAHILQDMAIPENKTRFILDVENASAQGKNIIGLLEMLRDGNSATSKALIDILGALASVTSAQASGKS